MNKCPFCGSENIYFSKKRQVFVCEECDQSFTEEELSEEKETNQNNKKLTLFFSYGHDENAIIVEKIKNKFEENGFNVWIDKNEIKTGNNWRKEILNGIINSSNVVAFLSEYSTRKPGVCLDELKIASSIDGVEIKTVLLEPETKIKPPSTLSNNQWLDMSGWKEYYDDPTKDFETWFNQKFEQLLEIVTSNYNEEFEGEVSELKRILSPELNIDKEAALFAKDFYGRKWLEDKISNWTTNSKSNVLMLYGGPGSGKSAFSVNYSHYHSEVYGCFLCEWNHEESINASNLIKTIAFKLATKMPDYRLFLLSQLKKDISLDSISSERLFDYLLTFPLSQLVDGGREPCVVFIDGLDEAETNDGCNLVADVFSRCVSLLPHWIKFIFTSRPEYSVQKHFKQFEVIDMAKDMPEGYNDILSYLIGVLDDKLHSLPNKLEILNKICQLSEDTFLYAEYLVSDIRNDIVKIEEINTLPKGLNAFYLSSMQRKFRDREDFSKARKMMEVLCISESIPEELLIKACGYSQYDYLYLLDKLASWVNRYEDDGLYYIGLSHKSIKDWFTNIDCSFDYFVDYKAGAYIIAEYSKTYLSSSNRSNLKLGSYIENHICDYFVIAEDYQGLESFLLNNQKLYPFWLSWNKFPSHWDHKQMINTFWSAKDRDAFLSKLQKEGNSTLLLWIFNIVQPYYKIETFSKVPLSIYIDIVHLSGKYVEAVNIIESYLSQYNDEVIEKDEYLMMLKARKLHHSSFYRPTNILLNDALSLYERIDPSFHNIICETMLFIAGKYWLTNNWEEAKKWLDQCEEHANKYKVDTFHDRNARGLSMYYYHSSEYEKAIDVLPEKIVKNSSIQTRYEAYLVCQLANIYSCLSLKEDYALKLYKEVMQYTLAKGITGWVGHANLGIANVNYKLRNYEEAMDFANRALSIYKEIGQEWGVIMSNALIAACKNKMGIAPLKVLAEECIKRAEFLNFNSCIESIQNLIDGKSEILKLYMV